MKSLAKRAKLNEGHVKAARAYKAKVASLTSERAELRAQMQNMTEEVVKLKFDLRRTSMARARAEGREDKARDSLRVSEGELREVRDGLQTTQTELQVVRKELQSSQNELRVALEELQVARDELRNKAMLLDRARRETSEAESSIERLTDECHGLRRDLQRQETLVVQRDGAIASLKDRPALSGLLDGLLSRGGLLMLTRDWTLTLISPATRRQKSPFPLTALENQPPRLRPAPLLRLLLLIPCLTFEPPCTILLVCLFFFFFFLPWAPNPGYM